MFSIWLQLLPLRYLVSFLLLFCPTRLLVQWGPMGIGRTGTHISTTHPPLYVTITMIGVHKKNACSTDTEDHNPLLHENGRSINLVFRKNNMTKNPYHACSHFGNETVQLFLFGLVVQVINFSSQLLWL